jgi:hypothetical protein
MFELDPSFQGQVAPLEAAKQDTIAITRRTNAKLPHHRGLLPTYLVKKKCHLYITLIRMQLYNQGQQNLHRKPKDIHLMPKPKPGLM